MVNRAKAVGTEWENRCVKKLKSWGWPYAERKAQQGALDKGDLTGLGIPIVVECKGGKKFSLAQYQKELRAEMKNAQVEMGFVWVKAPGKSIDNSYCVVPPEVMELFLEMMR